MPIETKVTGSIAEVLKNMKKAQEDYSKGYSDYMKNQQMSPYEHGQADAKRDCEQRKKLEDAFKYPGYFF